MDIIQGCLSTIRERISDLDFLIKSQRSSDFNGDQIQQTQTAIEAVVSDKDKNIDKILSQQQYLKMLIERDTRIKNMKAAIITNKETIEQLRKTCNDIVVNSIKTRQELQQTQTKELEKFQMQQMKSIADDQRRHQELLDIRRKEIVGCQREIENEEKNRAAYLADVEKNLAQQLKSRQEMNRGNGLMPTVGTGVTAELHDPNHIELTSVDQYDPYGPTSTGATSGRRAANQPKPKRGGVARGRGKKRV